MTKVLIKSGVCAVLFFTIFYSCEFRSDQVKNLEGRWKFSIGDDIKWSKPEYDDTNWDNIRVPSSWEEQGYEGYNGFAWYRKHVKIDTKYQNMQLYLNLGRVDDADEVYFNGVLIGKTGSFPPYYSGKYTENRRYLIPKEHINFGKDNIIAVRVYDNRENGGIREGSVGLFSKGDLSLGLDLSGVWKFHLNDSLQWKEPLMNDSTWKNIKVPSYFEDQGFNHYDGFAWYRKKFDLPGNLKGRKLVLILGKIDDIDQVYINGLLVGGIGTFRSTADSIDTEDSYNEFRGYYLPDNLILKDSGNIIAVRIFDKNGNGGIYEGPIGLILQENYKDYWEGIRKKSW